MIYVSEYKSDRQNYKCKKKPQKIFQNRSVKNGFYAKVVINRNKILIIKLSAHTYWMFLKLNFSDWGKTNAVYI